MQRRLFVLEGSRADTRREAAELLVGVPAEEVLWAGGDGLRAKGVRALLGRSFSACVVEMTDHFNVELLAQCHGFVVAGGALIVCLPQESPEQSGLAAYGFSAAAVSDHLFQRVRRVLRDAAGPPGPLTIPCFEPRGTPEQDEVVRSIVAVANSRGVAVLTADRGRGKSTAVGLALQQIGGRIAVTAENEDAVREVFAFAPKDPRITFVPAPELLHGSGEFDFVVVDEAAQLAVPVLLGLVARFPETPMVFATTTHGYEGTGRGFGLRFVEQLRRSPRELVELGLVAPIRWGEDDIVENAVFDALLLDAEPLDPPAGALDLAHREVPRDELAADDALLRQVFGLLVQAHYRTTPGDLHRLLDAPNLAVHASFIGEVVVAATLVAREGQVPPAVARDLAAGARRLVGHALPETFAAHLGRPDAATLSMIRSVRIATHPGLRRRGVASRLIEHIHAAYDIDLVGTLFGATPELLRFRRHLGYEVVRLSASRGRRSGVPSVAMIRPFSQAAGDLLVELRAELARDLPVQLELCSSDGTLQLDDSLTSSLLAGLGDPQPLSTRRRNEIVRSYALGPRTFESAAVAVAEFVKDKPLGVLDPPTRLLVERRVLERTGWQKATADSGFPTVPAAMRGLRRAIRRLIDT